MRTCLALSLSLVIVTSKFAGAQTAAPAAPAAPVALKPVATPADFKGYTESIAGTEMKFDLVPIPGGEFEMGSPATEEKRGDDEGPVHKVKIAPFWMGKFEVTWDEYYEYALSLDIKRKEDAKVDKAKQVDTEKAADAVTRPTPPYADMTFGYGRLNQPAICMTHHSAMEYCRWLSAKTGKTYRLPTEAEWEYACRAGTKTAYSFGDDAEKLPEYGWFVENTEKPMPIGKKKPNPWGLFDMHGNVAEWCVDFYEADAYAKFSKLGTVDRPVVLPTKKEYSYVARGGSWDDDPDKLRSAGRRPSNLDYSVRDPQRPQSIWWHTDAQFVGFRVVRPVEEQENLNGFRSPVVKGKGTR